MSHRRTLSTLAAAGAALLTVALAPAPAHAAAWGSCPLGNVCFYTGADGTGKKCAWHVQDPDWTAGTMVCSWATRSNVWSVWNNGEDADYSGVAYYLNRSYGALAGCTPQGTRENLPGSQKFKSHRWIAGTCR